MKKLLILSAVLIAAWSVAAQPKPVEVVSKADRTTVAFVTRDAKPVLMDIYQFKDRTTDGKRPVFIYSFGGAWAMGSRVDTLCNPLYDHLYRSSWTFRPLASTVMVFNPGVPLSSRSYSFSMPFFPIMLLAS